MPRKRAPAFTAFELEIMRIIWRRGEVTVLDVRAELEEGGKAVALPTIRTMLGILQEKGHVTRRASGRQHIYSPTGSESEGEGRILKDVVKRVFDGSAGSLVAALVRSDMVSRKELTEAMRLIDEHEKGGVK